MTVESYVTLTTGSGSRPCGCVQVALVTATLVCCLSALMLSVYMATLSRELGERLSRVELVLEMERSSGRASESKSEHLPLCNSSADEQATFTDVIDKATKRSKRRARGRRRSGRRRSHRHGGFSFVHLVGTSYSGNVASFTSDNSFRWSRRDAAGHVGSNVTIHMSGLSLEPAVEPSTVRILTSGFYLVYSQVALNGRDTGNHHDRCGHQTVLVRNQGETILMESEITQHGLGDAYDSTLTRQRRASDTIFHMGSYQLLAEDRLRVRRPSDCSHIRYRSDPNLAYFGVVRLHRL